VFGGDAQPVDAGAEGGLQGGRHLNVGDITTQLVGAGPAVQHAAFGQIAHYLLNEKRVPGSAGSDQLSQSDHRWGRAQQFGGQRRGLGTA